jgi:hypothetical protein
MPLSVNQQMSSSPTSLPQTGGKVNVTFQARSLPTNSRLKAAYSLAPGSTFQIVGSSTLAPTNVGTGTFQGFTKQLDIRPRPGVPPSPTVFIDASVQEVSATGQPIGAPQPARRILSIQNAAAAVAAVAASPQPAPAPGGSSGLGQSLRSFREAAGLSQEAVAQQLQVSRSTVSRVERGQEPSQRMAEGIRAMIGGSPS